MSFDSCGCDYTRRTFLYVGRAVALRNRLQGEMFRRVSSVPFEWINELMDDPHNHQVFFSVWHMPKNRLLISEATLIDFLNPIKNRKDRGFGCPDLWQIRPPDIDCASFEDIDPACGGDAWGKPAAKAACAASPVKNDPGVYAWWIDPGGEAAVMYDALGAMVDTAPNQDQVLEFQQLMTKRLESAAAGSQDQFNPNWL